MFGYIYEWYRKIGTLADANDTLKFGNKWSHLNSKRVNNEIRKIITCFDNIYYKRKKKYQ